MDVVAFPNGGSFVVQMCAAAVGVAVGCVTLVPWPACVVMAAAMMSVGPALAVVIAALCCAQTLCMALNMVWPPWGLPVAIFSACAAAWIAPKLPGQLQCRVPSPLLARFVAVWYPILAGLMLVLAVLVRVDAVLPWLAWGGTFLLIGLGQRCAAGVRTAVLRSVLGRGYACLVVFLLTVILVEAGLRFIMLVAPVGGAHTGVRPIAEVVMPHERRFYTYAPNHSGSISFKIDAERTGQFSFSISRHGLRGIDYGPKGTDELRILILGDSYAFGWALEDRDTIEAVLEKLLARACPEKRVTVINAGVWGYSVWQERDLLNEVGFALEPDIVVHMLFPANDIDGAWERRKSFPRTHSVEWRRTLQQYMYRDNWRFWLQDAVLRHWRALAVLKRAFPKQMGQPVVDGLAWVRFVPQFSLPRIPQPEDQPFQLELCKRDWDPAVFSAFAEMCGDIEGTRDDCRSRRVDYVAAVLPSPCALADVEWRKVVGKYPDGYYVQGKDVSLTEKALGDAGIQTVPLSAALRSARQTVETHYSGDGHLNPQGALVVSETLRKVLISQYLPGRCKMGVQPSR